MFVRATGGATRSPEAIPIVSGYSYRLAHDRQLAVREALSPT